MKFRFCRGILDISGQELLIPLGHLLYASSSKHVTEVCFIHNMDVWDTFINTSTKSTVFERFTVFTPEKLLKHTE